MTRFAQVATIVGLMIFVAAPYMAGAEAQHARARGGGQTMGTPTSRPSAPRGQAVRRRSPGPSRAAPSNRSGQVKRRAPTVPNSWVMPGSRRTAPQGPQEPTRRVRPKPGGPAPSPSGASGLSGRQRTEPGSRGLARTSPGKSSWITKRAQPRTGKRPTTTGVPGTVLSNRPRRIVEVDGTRQIGSNTPRSWATQRTGSPIGPSTGTIEAGDVAASSGRATPRNRRPDGPLNVTGRAVRRPLVASSWHGDASGNHYVGGCQYRGWDWSGRDHGCRYLYSGGHARHASASYYGHRPIYRMYSHRTHVRYPRYFRPKIYGSFFYFSGYGLNVRVGLGYPTVYDHSGYSDYAAYPYTLWIQLRAHRLRPWAWQPLQ